MAGVGLVGMAVVGNLWVWSGMVVLVVGMAVLGDRGAMGEWRVDVFHVCFVVFNVAYIVGLKELGVL